MISILLAIHIIVSVFSVFLTGLFLFNVVFDAKRITKRQAVYSVLIALSSLVSGLSLALYGASLTKVCLLGGSLLAVNGFIAYRAYWAKSAI